MAGIFWNAFPLTSSTQEQLHDVQQSLGIYNHLFPDLKPNLGLDIAVNGRLNNVEEKIRLSEIEASINENESVALDDLCCLPVSESRVDWDSDSDVIEDILQAISNPKGSCGLLYDPSYMKENPGLLQSRITAVEPAHFVGPEKDCCKISSFPPSSQFSFSESAIINHCKTNEDAYIPSYSIDDILGETNFVQQKLSVWCGGNSPGTTELQRMCRVCGNTSELSEFDYDIPSLTQEKVGKKGSNLHAKGGKDRHRKVKTAKGLRDRRIRLSFSTATQFYDIQERLGYDHPSKVLEWMMKKAKKAIDELPPPSGLCSSEACHC